MAKKTSQGVNYQKQKERQGQRNRAAVREATNIGWAHPPRNPKRRRKAEKSFQYFCEEYLSDVFYLTWSDDHIRVMKKIEKAVMSGGLFALAMPRGSGKTMLCRAAVLWAALAAKIPFITLIAAAADQAQDHLENIKIWLETNNKLDQDFNEVTLAVRALERIANRQKGQHQFNVPTRIEWNIDKIVLPICQTKSGKYKSEGFVISCTGMKGSMIRGQNHARADGKVVRPELVFIDDPQTTESAWSPSQSRRRVALLAGDILGMAGPGKKIAGLMACTVIRPGDMADEILDRDKHPEWQGERTKMLVTPPINEKLWDEYVEIRRNSLKNDGDGAGATDFYKKHRKEMDEGASVSWPERFNRDELSAIQHAMNLMMRDKVAFQAEYQNDPVLDDEGLGDLVTEEDIYEKLNGYAKRAIPETCNHLTMFVDVHKKLLYWILVAWQDDFSGFIIDYGSFPSQNRKYFSMSDSNHSLGRAYPKAGMEGALYAGLKDLIDPALDASYRREDGAHLKVGRCLIDANWGQSTDVIYQYCRQTHHTGNVFPAHGIYLGASSQPFTTRQKKKGEKVGLHWRMTTSSGRHRVRYIVVDTNFWKSFVCARFGVAMGDPGSLSLYGREKEDHRILVDHVMAEYCVKTVARGREVDEWKLRSNAPDNHFFDCLVGSHVAASMLGARLPEVGGDGGGPRRKRISLAELQRKKHGK